jgi:hypothetical protein
MRAVRARRRSPRLGVEIPPQWWRAQTLRHMVRGRRVTATAATDRLGGDDEGGGAPHGPDRPGKGSDLVDGGEGEQRKGAVEQRFAGQGSIRTGNT